MKYFLLSISLCTIVFMISCGDEPVLLFDDQLEKDIAAIDRYLDKNDIEAVEHESGIRYVITEEGDGARPIQSNSVKLFTKVDFLMERNLTEAKMEFRFPFPTLFWPGVL